MHRIHFENLGKSLSLKYGSFHDDHDDYDSLLVLITMSPIKTIINIKIEWVQISPAGRLPPGRDHTRDDTCLAAFGLEESLCRRQSVEILSHSPMCLLPQSPRWGRQIAERYSDPIRAWPQRVPPGNRGVRYAKSLSIQYFIDIDILQKSLIDIDIFKNVLIDINIFRTGHIDIDIFKSGLIDINIDIFKNGHIDINIFKKWLIDI